VRELRNVLAYAFAMGDGPILQPNHLPAELLDPTLADSQEDGGARAPRQLSAEAERLLDALRRTGGNKKQAANLLGMSRVTLWRRLQELGIADEDEGGKPTA
jgi:transcriptional regulator of acetoin/glycerol metabolism